MPNYLLSKKEPEKNLVKYLREKAGRGRSGRITVRHRGAGVKRLYRVVDFGQSQWGVSRVLALEYDPNRTSFLALVESDGRKRYVLAAQGVKVGDELLLAEQGEIKPGNRFRLKNIPVGTLVFNVELQPNQGGQLVRSAGATAKVLAQEGGFTHLEMPSKEVRQVPAECFATIGSVSHEAHVFEKLRKAGQARRRGWRPTVRGSAMNPVDHPHGGGEGKTPIGLKYPKTAWGKPARGVKTRKKRKWTDKFILQRRKK